MPAPSTDHLIGFCVGTATAAVVLHALHRLEVTKQALPEPGSHPPSTSTSAVATTEPATEDPAALLSLFDADPEWLHNLQRTHNLSPENLSRILRERVPYYHAKLKRAAFLAKCVDMLNKLPRKKTKTLDFASDVLVVGDAAEMSDDELHSLRECLVAMRPWKKGPLRIFGIDIDSEWRSDLKWQRISPQVQLTGKTVCDLGCGNGYFMFRMLEQEPSLVIGIDPNIKAYTEYHLLQHFVQEPRVQFEFMDGDIMDAYYHVFDTVFCLGVLYHTPDPMGMLRKIHLSMKPGGQLIVDCMGIPDSDFGHLGGDGTGKGAGNAPLCLVPRSRYTNMKGVWFLPTLQALLHWIARANFRDAKCFFAEPLSVEEQRATEWADIKSLTDALDPQDNSKTIEGYPAPWRFYITAKRN